MKEGKGKEGRGIASGKGQNNGLGSKKGPSDTALCKYSVSAELGLCKLIIENTQSLTFVIFKLYTIFLSYMRAL